MNFIEHYSYTLKITVWLQRWVAVRQVYSKHLFFLKWNYCDVKCWVSLFDEQRERCFPFGTGLTFDLLKLVCFKNSDDAVNENNLQGKV